MGSWWRRAGQVWLGVWVVTSSYAAEPFGGLRQLELDRPPPPVTEPVVVHFNPALAQPLNIDLGAQWRAECQCDDIPRVIRALRTHLSVGAHEWYVVDYDAGPSVDPTFYLYREADLAAGDSAQPLASLPGTQLYIPGNGALYLAGHSNSMFDRRRKFELRDGVIAETPQPYLAVDLTSRAKVALTLYASQTLQQPVASLPVGSELTVVLADGDYYLLRTPFGLLGWVKIESTQASEVVEGLFFAGD